jgi:Carboxypeptidase regulatory-like domain
MVRVFRWSLLICSVIALMSGTAIAQVTNGEVIGKVTDQTNAAVPGVTVTLESPAIQQPMVTVTQESGAYRFVQVPIGTYTITFSLPGFKTVKRPGVVVETGFSAEINTKLEVSTREEVINVTAASPVVDTKNTTTGAAFNRETLDIVPTARDPWVVLNMVPGVMLSGVNVGGSASGQQLTPTVRGSGSGNNMWNMEGASTTDMAATGASAVYYDFDSFAEIQVTTGGSDASIQTGGLNINLISKSGSNVFKGFFSGAYEDDNMQWKNVSRDRFYGGGTTTSPLTGTPMIKNYEYGGDAGGPIIRNRLWYWGAARKNLINNTVVGFFKTTPECTPVPNSYDQIKETIRCMYPDWTELINYNAKFNYQLNSANRFQFLMQFGDKIRNARGASTTQSPETAYRQSAWYDYGTPTYNFKHTWVLTDKLVFDNGFNHTGGGFYLDFQDVERQWDLQPHFNDVTNVWTRSFNRSVQGPRPNTEIKTDSSYFWSNLLGGDHQVKFGIRYKWWETGGGTHWGGNAIAQYDDIDGETTGTACSETRTTNCYGNSLSPELARFFRDANTLSKSWTYGAYIQDNYSRGKLRLNVGVRYDFQDGETLGTCVPASSFAPELLPAFCWDGFDATANFKDWAPRISATYDLFGTGKTVLKGTYAMFFDQGGGISNLGGNPAGTVELNAPWNDANGDTFVQMNELDLTRMTLEAGNFDISTGLPESVVSDEIVDANAWNGRTREYIATISHELMANFGMDVSYIYRKDDHNLWEHRIGETRDMWVRREWPNASTTAAQIASIPAGLPTSGWIYYEIAPGVVRPANLGHTKRSPEYANYSGWEIAARKRMSNRWMMNASFTWNDRRTYDDPEYDQTNNIQQLGYNGQVRYVVKFNGAVQLPKGFTLSQNTIIQEGNARTISFFASGLCRSGGLRTNGTNAPCLDGTNTPTFQAEPTGTTHLPATMLTDLALSKQFRFARGRAITFDVTMFNLFNVNTIRGYSSNNLSQGTFTRVSSIVPPRVVRVFARLQF